MTTQYDPLVVEFAEAKAHANDGRDRCGGPFVLDNRGQSCTPEMARLHNAQDVILALAGSHDLPPPVSAFIAAESDRGCSSCWFSSSGRNKQHPECADKIDHWFEAYEGLAAYGQTLTGIRSA